MTILAVSNNSTMLERLCNGLSSILPDADIIRETDSLMAGKYSFNHNIDMLFADVNMKRMGGVELIRFARQEHPGVLSYLILTISALCFLKFNYLILPTFHKVLKYFIIFRY